MAEFQNFRTAFAGFRREDVVNYIEYMNNKHKSQLEQLNTQLATAQEQLDKFAGIDCDALQAELAAANEKIARLEEQLACCCPDSDAKPILTGDELEAYRRAERAERLARERAAQIYAQANAALADTTVKVEAISDNMNDLTEQFSAKLQEGKKQLQDAVAALYAIRPEEEE